MVFSSITFLFFFLPALLALYFCSGKYRNSLLLLASLVFYAWGEGIYLLVMLVSIALNYTFGQLMYSKDQGKTPSRFILIVAICFNFLLLGFFKYANFITDNINAILAPLNMPSIDLNPVHLPIGISFFTFQAVSYLVDIYRKTVTPQKNLVNLGLYIALFPQLIAGPIVRYHNIASALVKRKVSIDDFTWGVQRFLFGLSKKVLLANPLGLTADKIFALSFTDLSTPLTWLGAVCYTLQIYYDFSGYSDMAIGLGRMFGFHFLENFNYPYISKSIREFWQRWHISLSSWFRDYLYIPLGGNRRSPLRTHFNLLIVFLLCGFWHGAGWTFICWGLYHGLFLVLERTQIGDIMQRLWPPFRHLQTLLIVIIGWVLFRSDNIGNAITYLGIMFGLGDSSHLPLLSLYVDKKTIFELTAAFIFSAPIMPALVKLRRRIITPDLGIQTVYFEFIYGVSRLVVLATITYFSIISLAAGVYNPFIYFRF